MGGGGGWRGQGFDKTEAGAASVGRTHLNAPGCFWGGRVLHGCTSRPEGNLAVDAKIRCQWIPADWQDFAAVQFGIQKKHLVDVVFA